VTKEGIPEPFIVIESDAAFEEGHPIFTKEAEDLSFLVLVTFHDLTLFARAWTKGGVQKKHSCCHVFVSDVLELKVGAQELSYFFEPFILTPVVVALA